MTIATPAEALRERAPRAGPRVVHLVQTLVGGGAETAVRMLCAGLPEAGIETSAVSVYPSGLDREAQANLGVPVIDLARNGRGDFGYFPSLVSTLRSLRPDVVHAHLHTGQYAGRTAAILAGVPKLVLTIHGREPGGPLRWLLDRVLHARTARFIVFTEAQRRRFALEQGVGLERIVVIPNGAQSRPGLASREALRRSLEIPEDAFAIYAVGRLSEEKNQTALLEGFAAAQSGGAAGMCLVFAGSGPVGDALQARARELGVAENVRFLGFRDDAAGLFDAMDLFALSSFREAMPLALGEAMLGGLAPLVTPWRDHDDFVRDGVSGYVAAGFDAASIAAAILRARNAGAARAAVGAEARASALRTFDPAAMVAAHAELYRAILS